MKLSLLKKIYISERCVLFYFFPGAKEGCSSADVYEHSSSTTKVKISIFWMTTRAGQWACDNLVASRQRQRNNVKELQWPEKKCEKY